MMTKKARFNNQQLKQNTVERQKLYKAKKRWLVAGISALATTGIITGGQMPKTYVHASTNHTPTQRTVHHHKVNGRVPSKHGLQFMTYKQYLHQKQHEDALKSENPRSKTKANGANALRNRINKSVKRARGSQANKPSTKKNNKNPNLDPNRPIALPKNETNGGSNPGSNSDSNSNPNHPIALPSSKQSKDNSNPNHPIGLKPNKKNGKSSKKNGKSSTTAGRIKGHHLQALRNGQSMRYRGRTITRIDTKGHFRHLRLLKPVDVYDNVLSLSSNKVGSLYSNNALPTLKIWRIFKVQPPQGGSYVRYEVKLHNMHYFVTASSRYTQNAYITTHNVNNMSIKAIRNISEYNSKYYNSRTKIKNIPKNKTMNVSKMVNIGHQGYKQTRFILNNGHYVTANKNFVRSAGSSSGSAKGGSSYKPSKPSSTNKGKSKKSPKKNSTSKGNGKSIMPSGSHIIPNNMSQSNKSSGGYKHRHAKNKSKANKANYRYVLDTNDMVTPSNLNNITNFGDGFNSGGGTSGELVHIIRKKNIDGRIFYLIHDKHGEDNNEWIYSGELGKTPSTKAHDINLANLWYSIIDKYSEKHESEFENQMKNESLGFINESRKKNSAKPLREEGWLDKVAQVRAKQLANNFSHYDKNHLILNAIDAKNLGFYPSYEAANHHISENIASAIIDRDGKEESDPTVYRELDGNEMGFASNNNMMYHDAHSNWGHRNNMLNKQNTAIGIGTYFSPKTHYFYLAENFSNANNHD